MPSTTGKVTATATRTAFEKTNAFQEQLQFLKSFGNKMGYSAQKQNGWTANIRFVARSIPSYLNKIRAFYFMPTDLVSYFNK